MNKTPHLFAGYGIELEYMIVRRDTLDILPITDQVLRQAGGEPLDDVARGNYGWSNELVRHVIEIKNIEPVPAIAGLAAAFQDEVAAVNKILAGLDACLLPGAMHPWMDPRRETILWPYGDNQIYRAYDRIFDCRGHGWSNLQSTHLNLAFQGDEEFARLHSAIRLLLPILPGLAASSPFVEGRASGMRDTRLHYYLHNQARIPSIAGLVIPERVASRQQYVERIHQRIFRDIAPFDPENILRHEWLNSRGAIARFERSAIEIRVLDIQECPAADLAVVAAINGALQCLVREEWSSLELQNSLAEEELLPILLSCIEAGEGAVIDHAGFLSLFAFPGARATAAELWSHLVQNSARVPGGDLPGREVLGQLLRHGTLAGRLLRAAGRDPDHARLREIYQQLARCLVHGELFLP
ncbi:MAG: carboxylate-amine ligase [Desulfobulbaceae bacterium]